MASKGVRPYSDGPELASPTQLRIANDLTEIHIGDWRSRAPVADMEADESLALRMVAGAILDTEMVTLYEAFEEKVYAAPDGAILHLLMNLAYKVGVLRSLGVSPGDGFSGDDDE